MSLVWSWWNAAVDWLMGAAGAVLWTFVGKWLVCALMKWICVFYGFLLSYMMPVAIAVMSALPTMPTLVVHRIAPLWRVVNYWFPLNETMGTILLCVVVISVWRLFRFVKQFLPAMSN